MHPVDRNHSVQIRLSVCPQEINLKSDSTVRRMFSATGTGR